MGMGREERERPWGACVRAGREEARRPVPSASAMRIISASSSSVGFCPTDAIKSFSSLESMLPPPSCV